MVIFLFFLFYDFLYSIYFFKNPQQNCSDSLRWLIPLDEHAREFLSVRSTRQHHPDLYKSTYIKKAKNTFWLKLKIDMQFAFAFSD